MAGRPRGYANWKPQEATIDLLRQVNSVLDEYREHLPLTVRQVFYRLVGQYGYDKTERAYGRLCEHLVRARRALIIPFDAIRDDGTAGGAPQVYDDVAGFWSSVRDDLKHFSRDRQTGQPSRIELWCEAAGMVPQLQRVAFRYSVPVYSTGGFSSVTVTREIAMRALEHDVNTVFLHVGDFDPSGASIYDAMARDAAAFVKQHVMWESPEVADIEMIAERVALTEDQVYDHGLPTAPPKATDSRSRAWEGETCQAEAMPPSLLADVVREAIEAHLDMDRYAEEVDRERADRLRIREVLDEVHESGGDDDA